MTRKKRDRPDPKHFVQVNQRPSLGIELHSGRPWVGVDQQVGHGSADALFELTDEHYASEMAGEPVEGSFVMECWRGEHNDKLLYYPGGRTWRPERWSASRTRRLPDPCRGEIWWHVDALGESADSESAEISRQLAADTAEVVTDPEGVLRMTFALVGDRAYPRPAALIGGLTVGSTRDQARAILGAPVRPETDTFQIEGHPVHLTFIDDGLVEVVLERTAPVPPPAGQIGVFLAAVGEPEASPAFQAAAALAGTTHRRWAASSGVGRRLLTFDGGVEMQVQDDRVISVQVSLSPEVGDSSYRSAADLLPGADEPLTRESLRAALGGPVASSGRTDLYRFGRRDLVVEHGVVGKHGVLSAGSGEVPTSMTAVLRGVTPSDRFYRWRSGEFTMFLDVLGRPSSNALVARVSGLPGVRVRLSKGLVASVEIGTSGHQSERFGAFVDGMPGAPVIGDIAFSRPGTFGDRGYVWDFDRGWIHALTSDGTAVKSITVTDGPPRGFLD